MTDSACVDCGKRLVDDVDPGGWCARCFFGLADARQRLLTRLEFRLAFARTLSVFRRLRDDPSALPSARPHAGLLALSAIFLGLWLALVFGGVLLVLRDFPGPWLVAGIACLAVAFLIRPRSDRARVWTRGTDAEQSPALHALVGRVAAAVGVPAPRVVRVTPIFDAAAFRNGPRRRPTLDLGVPLMLMLSGPERVGLIAYELARLARGDARRAASLRPLLIPDTLAGLMHPEVCDGIKGPLLRRSLRGLLHLLTPVRVLARLLDAAASVAAGRAWHHAVYRAERTAARVAGRGAMVSLGDKAMLLDELPEVLKLLAANGEADPATALAAADALVEEARSQTSEVRLRSLRRNWLGEPAMALRGDLVRRLPETSALVTVGAEENAALDAELARLYPLVQLDAGHYE